jgi:hypothetical protein
MKSEALRRVALAMFFALWCAGPAQSHHSTAAEFDQAKPVTFTGTVKLVVWLNPHIYTHVEVKREGTPPVVYHVEGGSPNSLFRQGWRKDSLQVGEVVTVTGQGAKNPESPNVGQATIVTADGRRIFSGNAPAKVDQN